MFSDPVKSDNEGGTSLTGGQSAIEAAGGRRRLVEIRCGFAEKARQEADSAAQRVVEAKRLYDEQVAALARAQAAIDLAAVQAAKDTAHGEFRVTVDAARNRRQVEAAAIGWLKAINEINGQGRAARAQVRRESQAADEMLSQLTRLSDFAEAGAAMASSANQACIAARAALEGADAIEAEEADGVEGAPVVAFPTAASAAGESSVGTPAAQPVEALSIDALPAADCDSPPASPTPSPAPSAPAEPSAPDEPSAGAVSRTADWLIVDIRAPEPQMITRLMRHEGRTLSILVDRLAGSDPAARSRWQLLLSNFVDSVVAAAIDDGYLEIPRSSPFWDQFSVSEVREVARGLIALGFRYDGFGAFVDGRLPTRRDLALAVGAAGLLPVRIRHWPTPDETAVLFRGVEASADAFLAVKAPALTLGELVRALGRRAEPLADLWNDWAAIRPLLFSTDD